MATPSSYATASKCRPFFFLIAILATASFPSKAALPLTTAQHASSQCSDTIDNDFDGLIDMLSPYCKTPEDNDEGSFGSGNPSDDGNFPHSLDCFFDLNSGSGDDGCQIHACCMIDGPCPADMEPELFDPGQCTVSATCVDNCQPVTRQECDCFGCCRICAPGSNDCVDVMTNPVVSPQCTLDTITNTSDCRSCTLQPDCKALSTVIFSNGFEATAFVFKTPETTGWIIPSK